MTDKREQIAAVATQAIQKSGLRSVSFRSLADQVGVKSSSVHYHFPTKPDLAQPLVRGYTERFEAQLADIERRQPTLLGKLEAVVDVFEGVLAGQDPCLCGMMAAELTALDDSTRHALLRLIQIAEGWLEKAFEAHKHQLSLMVEPAQLAKIFLSGLEGAILIDREEDRTERLAAFRVLARALVN